MSVSYIKFCLNCSIVFQYTLPRSQGPHYALKTGGLSEIPNNMEKTNQTTESHDGCSVSGISKPCDSKRKGIKEGRTYIK